MKAYPGAQERVDFLSKSAEKMVSPPFDLKTALPLARFYMRQAQKIVQKTAKSASFILKSLKLPKEYTQTKRPCANGVQIYWFRGEPVRSKSIAQVLLA